MTLKKTFILLLTGFFIGSFGRLDLAKADPAKDFVMSCTYGVLAGALVGTATLAFTDKPGDNLNRIARGASIGLYAGIILGLYVVNLSSAPVDDETLPTSMRELPRLQVYPLISEQYGVEGGAVQYSLLKF